MPHEPPGHHACHVGQDHAHYSSQESEAELNTDIKHFCSSQHKNNSRENAIVIARGPMAQSVSRSGSKATVVPAHVSTYQRQSAHEPVTAPLSNGDSAACKGWTPQDKTDGTSAHLDQGGYTENIQTHISQRLYIHTRQLYSDLITDPLGDPRVD